MMMGQSQNQNQRGRSSTPASRLSASAKPFIMNHSPNPQPISKFANPAFDLPLEKLQPISYSVSGPESLPLIDAEEDNLSVGAYDYHGYHSGVPFDDPREVGPESYYHQYLSDSDFDMGFGSLTISKTPQPIHAPNKLSIGVGERGKRVDNEGSFCWVEKNDGGLMSCETLLKQGKAYVAEELNSSNESSNVLKRKHSNFTQKYNQATFGGTEQMDAKCLSVPVNELTPSKFSTSSDLHSAATLNDVHRSRVSYQKPVVSRNNFTLGSSSVTTTVPHSEGKSYFPFVFGSSGSTATSSPNTRAISENVNTAVNNNQNSLGHTAASVKELCFIPSAESKGKDRIIDKLKSNEPLSPLKIANSAPQVISDDFSSKHQDAEVCDPVENSSRSFDVDNKDLDLDSPCWKGTQNSVRSPFAVSQPVNSHLGENEVEAHNSLNPMAPHFFPCYGKSSLCQTSFIENNITSSQKSPVSAYNLLSRENELTDSIKVGSCPPDDISESNAENDLINISDFGGAVLNSSQMVRPYLMEGYFTSKGEVVSKAAVANSLKGITAECVPSSSFSGFGVPTNMNKTFQDVPNSLYRSSGIDGHMVVNALSNLSELLVQNFSNDLDKLDRDAVQHIINNLYVCIGNRYGQRTPLPESTRPGISLCLEKSTDHQNLSNMEVQVTRGKAVSVSHDQNYTEVGRNNFSTTSSRIEEGNFVSKAMKNALKDDPFKEEMHPQSVLYRNLWLEAEAAVCAMKYKAHLLHMRTQMEQCRK